MEASADAAMQQGVPVSLVLLIAFFGMLMFFTAMVSLPIYLQKELGYSPVFTGNSVALCIAVVFAGTGFGLSTPLFNSLVVRKSRPEKKSGCSCSDNCVDGRDMHYSGDRILFTKKEGQRVIWILRQNIIRKHFWYKGAKNMRRNMHVFLWKNTLLK